MLESMRKQGASVFIYLIFGLLIAIFVINMGGSGSGSGGSSGGCSGSSNVAITVDGHNANHTSYLVAYSSYHNEQIKAKQRQYVALERLIRREILANAAEKHGLRVSPELVESEIKKGNFFMAGQRIPLGQNIFDDHEDGEPTWNLKKYKGWVAQLNVSMNSYQDEQAREIQAAMMADLLKGSVRVSRDEAFADYLYDNTTVTYDVVAFSPTTYRSALRVTEADATRFLATHEDEVKARFKADERLYEDVKPQLKLRQIFIAKAEPPAAKPDEKKADDKKAADDKKPAEKVDDKKTTDAVGGPKKPVGLPIEEAKAKLEAVRTAAATNKQKFVDAAKELSTEAAAKATSGDLGWHTANDPQLLEKAVNDAVKALKVGEMTPVITTDRGAYLLMAEGTREKKLTYDQVKLELAQEVALDVWSKEAAKRAAITALENARAGTGKNLEQLYEKAAPPPSNMQMPDLENMPPEQRKMIEEMMRKQGIHGSIDFETKDVPAAWYAQADGAGGGSGSATGSAAGSATPKTGSAAGSAAAVGSAATAGSAAGTGSAAGSGAKPAEPPATATNVDPPIAVTADQLPVLGDVAAPKVVRTGPAPRSAKMPNVSGSKEVTRVLFDELGPGMLAKRVYESDGNFVVVQLITKAEPKIDEFDKTAEKAIDELRESRATALVEGWLKQQCEQLAKDERIKASDDLIRESDDTGKPLPTTYKPCMFFR